MARDIARIVGANSKQDGYLEGSGYLVTWAMGHLITLAMPEAYGYGVYKAEELPIHPNPFQLIVRQVRKGKEYHNDPAALKQLKAIRHCFTEADRIIVATDAGRMPSEKFTQGINSYTHTICEELLTLSLPEKSYPSYYCPKCGKESMGIYAKIAKCRSDGCGFVIFREVCATFLSEDNLRDLITTRRTLILKGLVSKAGKKFNARLVLGNDFKATFEFDDKAKKSIK